MRQLQDAGSHVEVCRQIRPETRLERFRIRKQKARKAEEVGRHRRHRHQPHQTRHHQQQRIQLSINKCQQLKVSH